MIAVEIRQIDPQHVHIELTREELKAESLSYGEIDYQRPETRRWLRTLLETARREAGFKAQTHAVVEVWPAPDGGCTVDISSCEREPRRWKVKRHAACPVMYGFEDVNTLIESSLVLFRRASHRIHRSGLYRINKRWILVLYPLDVVENITLSIMDEYAPRCGEGALSAAWVYEHAEPVVREDAIDLMFAYFG